jgi:hypothetical protein
MMIEGRGVYTHKQEWEALLLHTLWLSEERETSGWSALLLMLSAVPRIFWSLQWVRLDAEKKRRTLFTVVPITCPSALGKDGDLY